MKKIRVYFYGFVLMIVVLQAHSQNKVEAFLKEDVNNAKVVIEGKVIEKKCFSTKTPFGIFTSATIRISKIFKGSISDTLIELVYSGGEIADTIEDGSARKIAEVIDPAFSVNIGDEGIFLLQENTVIKQQLHAELRALMPRDFWVSYINYFPSKKNNKIYYASCDGKVFHDVEKDLFQVIEATTGQKRQVIGLNQFERGTLK